jgi:hypothetical protein
VFGYWYRLLHGRFQLWQLIALGFGWIGGGIAFQVLLRHDGRIALAPALLFYASGAMHFWIARKALTAQRKLEAISEPAGVNEARLAAARSSRPPPRPDKPSAPPLPSPPRIGGDPFRNPPYLPIVVERSAAKQASTPVVAGDPEDKPKILT